MVNLRNNELTGHAQLFRNFELEIVNPSRPWKSENVGLWMQSEMWVRVTEREVVG